MKNNYILILFLATIFLSSCTRYLVPANIGNDMTYKQKPMVADSVRSNITISGGIAGSDGVYDEGTVTLGYLNINRGHTYKNLNFSYGLFSYYGKVNEDFPPVNDPKRGIFYLDPFDKTASGVGINSSIGYHFTSSRGNTDYRIINWENALTREFGSYSKFRQQLYGDLTYKRLIVSNSKAVWTTGISSEIIFHHRRNKHFKHAFKLFIGGLPNFNKSFDNEIKKNEYLDESELYRSSFQFTYFFAYKGFNATYQTDFSHLSASFAVGYSF